MAGVRMVGLVALVVGCSGPSPWVESEDGWHVGHERWAVTVGATGLDIGTPDGAPVHIAVSSVALGDTALVLDPASLALDGRAVVRTLAANVEERVEIRDEGAELSWWFSERPGAGDLVVRLHVAEAHAVLEDADGWHFVAGDRGVRIAPATWIDAEGVRTAVFAHAEGDTLSLVVPADVVERSSYPAVLDPVIGPELPVDEPATSVLGRYSPFRAGVAFDGVNYMIVWQHQHPFPGPTFSNDIVVARVRASDGVVLDPGGIAIAQGGTGVVGASTPDIAFDGTRFLVVWDSGGDTFGRRVATDGTLLDASPLVLSSATGLQYDVAVACAVGSCLAVWEDGRGMTSTQTIGTRIDMSRGIVRDPLGLVFASGSNDPDIASDGTDYLIAWTAGVAERATRVRAADGTPIGAPSLTVATGSFTETEVAYAAGQYVVTFRNIFTPSTAYAGRVRASDGAVLDATPATLSTSPESELGVAACAVGSDFLLGWHVDVDPSSLTMDYDVRGTVMRSSDGGLAPVAGTTLAGGFFHQMSPALAAGPTGQLIAVYFDGTDNHPRISARRLDSATLTPIDTTPIAVSVIANEQRAPAIASDGTDFLVVWSDGRGTDSRIYGARVRADGTPIDAPAFPISDGVTPAVRPAVAYGAGQYYVVWDDGRTGSDLYGARVGTDGTVIDATSRLVFAASGAQTAPSIAYDGARFVATWDDSRNTPSSVAMDPSDGSVVNPFGSPLSLSTGRRTVITCNPSLCLAAWINGTQAQATRVDHGSVLDATPIALGTVYGTSIDAATDGSSFVVAYQTGMTIITLNGRRVTSAGVVGSAVALRSGAEATFGIAWDGGSYDVAWSDGTEIGVVRTRADASALGAFTVPAPGTTTTESILSIASTGTGASLMGYDRPDYYTRTFGGWRVRVRPVAPSAGGAACTADADCASGHCVDSVCCDTACGGGTSDCQACSVAAGASSDGVCAPITAPLHVCRPSASACDVAEVCDGIGTTCPPNLLAPVGTVCRGAVDLCDAVESCSGTSAACPPDALVAAGMTCRPAAGACDVTESCDGVQATCPADVFVPDGMACADALTCNGAETCLAGACQAGSAPVCDDGDVCTSDGCAEPGGCAFQPIVGCGADLDAAVEDDAGVPVTDAGLEADGGVAARDAEAVPPDAGPTDASLMVDASVDAGATIEPLSGCGCRIAGARSSRGENALLALLVLALVARRRRPAAARR